MENEQSIQVGLSEDRSQAFLVIGQFTVGLSIEALESLLAGLAQAREQMTPPVPVGEEAIKTKITLQSTLHPHWYVGGNLQIDAVLLHWRHPGFGWLHFALPKQEAERLGQTLISATSHLSTPGSSPH